jgi:hypothetical protein
VTVAEVEPNRHLVAGEAFVVRHVPGGMLAARGLDFFVGDPLHHYMETGLLRGLKQRAEGSLTTRRPPLPGRP